MSASDKLHQWVDTCKPKWDKSSCDLATTNGIPDCGEWRINQGIHNPRLMAPASPSKEELQLPEASMFRWTNETNIPLKLYYKQAGSWMAVTKPMVQPGECTVEGNLSLADKGQYMVVDERMNPVNYFQVTQTDEHVHVTWPPPPPRSDPIAIPVKRKAGKKDSNAMFGIGNNMVIISVILLVILLLGYTAYSRGS